MRLQVILVTEHLLTTLSAGHALLLLLSRLRRAQLDLLLGGDNLVAHGIELLLLITVVSLETGTRALTLNPVVAGRSHPSVHDGPDLLSQVLGELSRVGNDDDTTLELFESLGQGTERVTVKIVGRLIKNDKMGSLPRASSQDSLDTLTTGQTTHTRVRNKLSVETEVGAVRLNLLSDQRSELTRGKGLLHINISNHLLVRSQKFVSGQPGVVSSHHGNPSLVLHANVLTEGERTLVLVRVLELSSAVDTNDTSLATLNAEDLVHGLLISLGDDLVGTVHGLTILTSLESPLDVLGRSLVEVVIDVSESVLLNVGDTDVLVLVDLTLGRDELTSEDVDQSRLASTIGTNNGNTRSQRTLEGDVADLGLGGTGVLEGHVGGTENGLGLGLDTLKETGLGEAELDLGLAKLVVGLSRGVAGDESSQVTLVTLELESLVVNDVLADVVKETRVVRDDDRSASRVLEVLLEPLNVLHIQMVGRLVKQQNIGSLKDGTAQGKLHLPTTREGADLTLNHLIGEAELVELLLDISLGGCDTSLLKLLHGPVDGGHLSISGVQVVLDEDSLDLVLLGETLDLLVVDSAHEGGLSGTVGTAKTVALTTLETEMSLVKKNLGTVGKREGTVAEILTLLFISLTLSLGDSAGKSGLADGLDDGLGVVNTRNDRDVSLQVVDPDHGLNLLLINELACNGRDVLGDGTHLLNVVGELGGESSSDLGLDNVDGTREGGLRDDTVLDVTNTGEGVKSLLGLLTGLGISQVVVVLLETWHHLGQERSDNVGIVDELAHVVNDNSGLSLDSGITLSQTTIQKRDHEGERGLLDLSNESGGTEQVNGLRDVLGLGDTLDELRNETLNILVDNQLAKLLHGLVSTLLDLLLGVPHGLGDDRDEFRNTVGELSRGVLDEVLDEVKSGHLFGPLLGTSDGLHDVRKGSLDSVGVDAASNGEDSTLGGILDSGDLVANGGKDSGEEDNEVRLDGSGDLGVRSDSLDGNASLLTGGGVLLVGELLLQALDNTVDKSG
ncbi:unnamed protein product [Fusarium venenatum]|uniref:Uncharacterized protein n=1 Tax=Fusarium venenatum TaxID=56646 RepID=A0A2L2T0F7_9HYPO|nr:uncharacterized protein FVRRES_07245 [Fusarium venenatum]CEI62809.1 unnamed protein product [Fusarium venenatum]